MQGFLSLHAHHHVSSQIGMNSPDSIYEVGESSKGGFWLGQEMERMKRWGRMATPRLCLVQWEPLPL
jgi:hypothetical protein